MMIFGIPTPLTPGILLGAFLASLGFALTLRMNGFSLTSKKSNNSVIWLLLFSQALAVAIFLFFH